jgi:hypothetical protein
MNINDYVSRKDLAELVSLLSYLTEIKRDLPAPYNQYAKDWEYLARYLIAIYPDDTE